MSDALAIPDLERELTLTDLVVYAGATWDWHRMHYDTDFARAKGMAAPVVDGQMLAALVAAQVESALGPQWRLSTLAFRFRNLVVAGSSIRSHVEVTRADDDVVEVVAEVHSTPPGGTEQVAMAPVTATLVRHR